MYSWIFYFLSPNYFLKKYFFQFILLYILVFLQRWEKYIIEDWVLFIYVIHLYKSWMNRNKLKSLIEQMFILPQTLLQTSLFHQNLCRKTICNKTVDMAELSPLIWNSQLSLCQLRHHQKRSLNLLPFTFYEILSRESILNILNIWNETPFNWHNIISLILSPFTWIRS